MEPRRIIGYGICGPGEAGRYLRQTLLEFDRLCDEVIILCNNTDQAEHELIDSFGFKRVSDRRIWGQFQWKIKQDFLERDVAQIARPGDVMICLDMDEVFDSNLTSEWLLNMELDAYYVYVIDLWESGYKPESCFWNVRIWRWNGDTKFKQVPVHCGLAPMWTYHYHRFAPFFLKHFGLMKKEDRMRRIERYKKYDPEMKHMADAATWTPGRTSNPDPTAAVRMARYYKMLESDSHVPFDEEEMRAKIAKEFETYKPTKPRAMLQEKPKARFAYVRNPHGQTVDIPERHLDETLKRAGFTFLGWADDAQKEMEEIFKDGHDELSQMFEEPADTSEPEVSPGLADLEVHVSDTPPEHPELSETDLDALADSAAAEETEELGEPSQAPVSEEEKKASEPEPTPAPTPRVAASGASKKGSAKTGKGSKHGTGKK